MLSNTYFRFGTRIRQNPCQLCPFHGFEDRLAFRRPSGTALQGGRGPANGILNAVVECLPADQCLPMRQDPLELICAVPGFGCPRSSI